MLVLSIQLTAKDDIQQIVDYYDEVSSNITDIFLESLYTELKLIEGNPFAFQIKYRNTRVSYLKKFSFGIHYRITDKAIEILAILHTSRHSKIWKQKSF